MAHNEAVKATIPSLGSFGEMSNFLGEASQKTSEEDISKLVEDAFERHHLTEKIANLKRIERENAERKEQEHEQEPVDIDKMVAESFERHHLVEKIADLKQK
jgi:chorismate mutase